MFLVLVVVAALWAEGPAASRADMGVAVDLGTVAVSQRLSRGGTYQLPTVGVRNPGTEKASYQMGVTYLREQRERQPDRSWFTFSPSKFDLEPGATQPVQVELNIPRGARPDDYLALLEARLAVDRDGPSVGAAAGAKVTFTVKPSNFLQAWQLEAQTWAEDHAPWSYLVPAVAALAFVAWIVSRRFEFRVARRPG